jgi:hypothetical protein
MRVGATTLVLILGAVVLAACGDDSPTDEERITEVVEKLQSDLRAKKVKVVCRSLGGRSRRQIGTAGHYITPTACPDDLALVVFNSTQYQGARVKGLGQTPPPRIASVKVRPGGKAATVAMDFGDGPFDVPFVQKDGRWMLDDFFGPTGPVRKDLQ